MVQRRGGARLRAAMGLLAVGAVVGYVGVAGAAERRAAANAEIKTTTSNTWSPPTASIATGETVTWNFDGSTSSHNMKGETGPSEDPNWPNENSGFKNSGTYSYTFNQPGTYTFICQAHPATMTGSVTVTGAPATPTATPSATATATATATASVTLRVKRGSRTVGTIRLAERAGSRSVTLRRLAKGRYSVEIEARDARGN